MDTVSGRDGALNGAEPALRALIGGRAKCDMPYFFERIISNTFSCDLSSTLSLICAYLQLSCAEP